MFQPKPRKILAIDPGTRHLGVALLDNGRPIYHGVKTMTSRGSAESVLKEGRELIQRYLDDFKPDILAVEKTFFGKSRNVVLLNVFANEIAAIGKRNRIQVVQIAPTSIRKRLCGNGHAGKEEVVKVIVSKLPEFKVYVTQDRKWKELYHRNMFDAIALGLVVQSLN